MQLMNPALTRMQEFPLNWTRSHIGSGSEEVGDGWELVHVFNLENAQGPPVALDEALADTTVLYTSLGINAFKKNEPWGELNHTSWVWRDPYAKPLLAMDKNAWHSGTEQANPLRTFKVPQFEAGEQRWMDLVVNNVDDRGHPFHFVSLPCHKSSEIPASLDHHNQLTGVSMGTNFMCWPRGRTTSVVHITLMSIMTQKFQSTRTAR